MAKLKPLRVSVVSLSISRRRKWGNKIHSLSLYFLKEERGSTGGVCRGSGAAVHMEKRKRGQRP